MRKYTLIRTAGILMVLLITSCGGSSGGSDGGGGLTNYGSNYNYVPNNWAGMTSSGKMLFVQFLDDAPPTEDRYDLADIEFFGGSAFGSRISIYSINNPRQDIPIDGYFSKLALYLTGYDLPTESAVATFEGSFENDFSLTVFQANPINTGFEFLSGPVNIVSYNEDFPESILNYQAIFGDLSVFLKDVWVSTNTTPTEEIEFNSVSPICNSGLCSSFAANWSDGTSFSSDAGFLIGDTLYFVDAGVIWQEGTITDGNTILLNSGVIMTRLVPVIP